MVDIEYDFPNELNTRLKDTIVLSYDDDGDNHQKICKWLTEYHGYSGEILNSTTKYQLKTQHYMAYIMPYREAVANKIELWQRIIFCRNKNNNEWLVTQQKLHVLFDNTLHDAAILMKLTL